MIYKSVGFCLETKTRKDIDLRCISQEKTASFIKGAVFVFVKVPLLGNKFDFGCSVAVAAVDFKINQHVVYRIYEIVGA